ncbi:phage tail assembly chaperone [Ramlibacter sp. MAHUQ-53]|uniref:phage tail assembly chaperone n=1 Tax=unclassified Ramlibacter TaxID=2617605 RepID=UPI0036395D24
MAKIVLGKRPKNFKRSITVDLPEGGKGGIEVSFIYRTRTEFGAFVDELMNSAGVKQTGQSDEEVKFSLEDALSKTRDSNADYILKIADGWNLDEDFSRANVAQLCDELPGAALQIIEAYRVAITEGRLGN